MDIKVAAACIVWRNDDRNEPNEQPSEAAVRETKVYASMTVAYVIATKHKVHRGCR